MRPTPNVCVVNVGTSAGNVQGLAFPVAFDALRSSDVVRTVRDVLGVPDARVHGWALVAEAHDPSIVPPSDDPDRPSDEWLERALRSLEDGRGMAWGPRGQHRTLLSLLRELIALRRSR